MKQELFSFLDSFKIPEDSYKSDRIKELQEYFGAFFKKYPTRNLNKLDDITDKEIMLPLIILNNPLNTKEILECIENYPKLFEEDKYNEILYLIILYFNDEEIYNIMNCCLSLNPFIYVPALFKISKIVIGLGLPSKSTDAIYFFEKNRQAKKDLKVVFQGFTNDMQNIGLELIDAIARYRIEIECDGNKELYESLPRIIKRETKDELLAQHRREKEMFSNAANKYFGIINTKLNEIITEYNKSERERNRNNRNIEELKRILDTSEEIRNIDAILRLCPNEEVKEVVVDYIIKHNKKVYIELIKVYEKNRQNSDENLNLLFTKYGFEYENLNPKEKQIIKEIPYSEIEKLLIRLKNLSISNINVAKINMFKLSTIEELVSKGIVTLEWLNNNLSIFYKDNTELEEAVTNIDILSKEGINMLQYSNSLDIIKSIYLKHNLYLLRLYGLAITKSTTNINFLGMPDLRNRIEFIFSLGNSDLNNLDVLNYSLKECLKLKVANSLNIPISCVGDDYEELICDFAPSIIPADIEEKLNFDSNFTTTLPEFLESFRVDNQILNINGVYVSIERLRRNLAKIGQNDNLGCFYAIIHKGYYTFEEIENLKTILIPDRVFFNLVRR